MAPIISRIRDYTPATVDIENRRPISSSPANNPDPGMSPVLRCPLPILTIPSPDNLRQYYTGGAIPQYRFSPPQPISTATASVEANSTSTVLTGSLTTTASTQDIVAVPGAKPNNFVAVSPTNAVAAAMTGVYSAIQTAGQVTVYHPAAAGGTFNISVTT